MNAVQNSTIVKKRDVIPWETIKANPVIIRIKENCPGNCFSIFCRKNTEIKTKYKGTANVVPVRTVNTGKEKQLASKINFLASPVKVFFVKK